MLKNFHNIKNKVDAKIVATYYQIASLFKFTELVKPALCLIQRCFAFVCANDNFLELNFSLIAKIISSSELRIDSEVEVINAIYNWISYDFVKRSRFINNLLSKVHLSSYKLVIRQCYRSCFK